MTTQEYIDSPLCIGFITLAEDVSKRIETKEYKGQILGIDVVFNVYLSESVVFPECPVIYTDEVNIADKLPMGGFGSHSHENIGQVIDAAIADFSRIHDLTLCKKINSWPWGIAICTRLDKK